MIAMLLLVVLRVSLLRCQYLYFCTSKAVVKLVNESTQPAPETGSSGVRIGTFVLVNK
jgi:hypothetical protein